MKSIIAAAGLVAAAQAFTAPVQPPSYGSLLTPDTTTPVTTGQDFTVTWTPKQPADGVTVSLVLCKGPSTNCVLQNTAIVEGISAAAAQYKWSVPCSLTPGVQNTDTGYGMLIIVDGTGEFQYSTQFSVLAGASCGGSGPSSSSSTTVISSSSSSSSSSSVSVTSSSAVPPPPGSSSAAPSDASDSWYPWASTSSTLVTSTVPLPTTSAAPTTPAAITTSKPAELSTYTKASSTTATSASSSVSAPPQQFTGAAVVPAAFANAAGLVGAAALAILAL